MGVQVQTATKDGQGNPLSILNRQFISFSYGGKDIEDFDLLASFDGDRLSKNIYSSFQDVTSEQSELDGQQYWASSYKANELNFTLVTDGIDSKTLEEFKRWFIPGVERELILTEHHARGILARVSNAPQMSLLPFEKEVNITFGEKEEKIIGKDENGNSIKKEFLIYYPTKTSLYKGDIKLSFVMDDPFWYSRIGCYKKEMETVIENGKEKERIKDPTKPQLKAFFEDRIPFERIISATNPIFFGNKKGWNSTEGLIDNLSINLSDEENCYFYYAGTASEKPKISFKIPLKMEDDYKVHFQETDDFVGEYTLKIQGLPYGTGDDKKRDTLQTITLSEPSIINSYNSVVDFIKENAKTDSNILDIRAQVRDIIYDKYLLNWTMTVIDCLFNNSSFVDIQSGKIEDGEHFQKGFFVAFKRFFFYSSSFFEVEGGAMQTLPHSGPKPTFTIDSKTGRVLLDIIVLKALECEKYEDEGFGLKIDENYNTNIDRHLPKKDENDKVIYTRIERLSITENAGNMVKSKYLTFEPVDFNIDGNLTEDECLNLTSTIKLEDLKIDYKYKYL